MSHSRSIPPVYRHFNEATSLFCDKPMKKSLLFASLFLFGSAHAEPAITVDYTFYDVYPTTYADLQTELTSRSPIVVDEKKYHGYTNWYVNWDFRWNRDNGKCKITSVETTLRVNYTMPKIPRDASVNTGVRRAFNGYYQALMKHEKGHRDSGLFAAREIEKALLNLDAFDDCHDLETIANQKSREIIEKYVQRDNDYDIRTQRGKLQGADLNNFINH